MYCDTSIRCGLSKYSKSVNTSTAFLITTFPKNKDNQIVILNNSIGPTTNATSQLPSRHTYGINFKILRNFILQFTQSQDFHKTSPLTLRSKSLRFELF